MPQRLKCLTKKQLLAQYRTELSNLVPIEDAEEPAKIQAHIRKKKRATQTSIHYSKLRKREKLIQGCFPFP